MPPVERIPPSPSCRCRLRSASWATLFIACLFGQATAAQEPGDAAVEASAAAESEAPRQPEAGGEGAGTGAPSQDVEEIIVQGRGADDSLQETAISGTRFDAQEMRALRIQNLDDLADYTPNLEINTAFANSNPTIFIRGIGLKDYNANAAGAIGIYQDGININSPAIQLFQLFDTESVEVLRGPQGSLNGRNSPAGAILIKSRMPGDELAAEANLTYGNYNLVELEGAFDVPLIPDRLLSRFSFAANFRDGIMENACADWNPQQHAVFADETLPRVVDINGIPRTELGRVRSYLVTEQTLLEEYRKDKLVNHRKFQQLQNNALGYGVTATNRSRRQDQWEAYASGAGGAGPLQPGVDQVKNLVIDSVCIVNTESIGTIITEEGERRGLGPEGTFRPGKGPLIGDFQGLKHKTNNWKDWAVRGVFVYQPDIEGMQWTLNVHGGQNLSDSLHLQGIQATSSLQEPLEFTAGVLRGTNFAEALIARATGFEGVEDVPGLEPFYQQDSQGNPVLDENGEPVVIYPSARASNHRKGYFNRDGRELNDAWGASVRGEWEFERFRVLSLTGYEWYDRLVEDEGDASPTDLFPANYQDSAWQVSQELRFSGESPLKGPQYQWNAGFFFLKEELEAFNVFPTVQGNGIDQRFDQELLSVAPYLNGSYWITEALSVEAGIRYNYERKDFKLKSTVVVPERGDHELLPGIPAEQKWSVPTGELTLRYEPDWAALSAAKNDSLMVYAKYARGFKGGHFNAEVKVAGSIGGGGSQTSQSVTPVAAEYIHSAEVGLKSDWLDGRLRLNAAGFRYWYTDLQVFDVVNEANELPFTKLLNADARVWGVEVELTAEPVDRLIISAGFGWLDGHFGDFVVEKTTLLQRGSPPSFPFAYTGNPLIAAPRYNTSGVVTYELPLQGWGALIPQYDYSYRSKHYFDPAGHPIIAQAGYWLHNARLTYRTSDERIELSGWVRNFLDKEYKVDVFDLTRYYSTILEVWGDPRTYGVSLWFAF